MASRALCHLRLQESDGTAKVILAPAAEKCVYRFRGLPGLSQNQPGCRLSHCSVRSTCIVRPKHTGALGFHRLVITSDISLEYLPNMAIRLLVNSEMTLKNSKGDLIARSLWANSEANCMLA
ncbi:hypothetical protein AB7M17_001086 [Bradyrhizobium sp. USDA 377]